MEDHFRLTDSKFMEQFENCTLDPLIFSHEAHLRLAWLHINRFGFEQAIVSVQIQLQKFVDHIGAKDKYNVTLTIAAVKAVHHFMQKSESHNFKEFIREFPRLINNFKELLSYHYGIDIFNSKEARTRFLEPDLQPFD